MTITITGTTTATVTVTQHRNDQKGLMTQALLLVKETRYALSNHGAPVSG